jgi:hypothetical protein
MSVESRLITRPKKRLIGLPRSAVRLTVTWTAFVGRLDGAGGGEGAVFPAPPAEHEIAGVQRGGDARIVRRCCGDAGIDGISLVGQLRRRSQGDGISSSLQLRMGVRDVADVYGERDHRHQRGERSARQDNDISAAQFGFGFHGADSWQRVLADDETSLAAGPAARKASSCGVGDERRPGRIGFGKR